MKNKLIIVILLALILVGCEQKNNSNENTQMENDKTEIKDKTNQEE